MTFKLNKETYSCGRKKERDICFPDPAVSTYHCDFVKTGNTYTIADRGSTNGTRVNNVPINDHELHNSDIIQIGDIEILFESDDKSINQVMRSRTNINLDDNKMEEGTVKMDNVSPFDDKNDSSSFTFILYILFAILTLAIIGLLLFLGLKIMVQETTQAKGNIEYFHC